MKVRTDQFVEIAREELAKRSSRNFLRGMSRALESVRGEAMASFADPAAAMEYGRAIRAEVVARLPELLEEFERNAVARGAQVVWARTAAEANDFVVRLARERNVGYVTKGKSMVTEEIGLNDALIENGIEVFEADLGEFIIQQLKRPPFHIVGPAINIPVEEICDLFMEMGILDEPTSDPVRLGAAARACLRGRFHYLELGITGVNMAVAETGTIINVENEGNIRFTKSSPRTQVSIMTLEKVVPTMRDAIHMLRLLCRSATGQKISAYVSMDTGPKQPGEVDGPEELFIVIVDNGRSDFYADPESREILRCIRCGTCMYSCPVYKQVGGYPYGWAYSGPMGQVLNPLLLGLDKTQHLYRACTLCGECKSVCPAGVDHPKRLLSYRARQTARERKQGSSSRPRMESRLFGVFGWSAQRAWRWNAGVRVARPLFNRYLGRGVRPARGPLSGWLSSRDFPPLSQRTFRQRTRGTRKKR